jgi:hypothetical protein
MIVKWHPHAKARIKERGAIKEEVTATIKYGERFAVKFGRSGFRRNFPYNSLWRGKHYANKQIEAIAVREGEDWVVITVIVRFY